MHLFLYFGVFHLDRVPEVGVLGFKAHVGWLGSKSVSKVWTSLRWRRGQRHDWSPVLPTTGVGIWASSERGRVTLDRHRASGQLPICQEVKEELCEPGEEEPLGTVGT